MGNSEIFSACVQYNDWVGTVSADNSDRFTVYQWLDERNLRRSSSEVVYGIKLTIPENEGQEVNYPVKVKFLLIPNVDISSLNTRIEVNNRHLNLRCIETVMTLAEFLSLFKRFDLTLSPNLNCQSLNPSDFKGVLEGITYQCNE